MDRQAANMSGRQSLGRQAKAAAKKRLADSSPGRSGDAEEKNHPSSSKKKAAEETVDKTKHEDYVYTAFFTRLSLRRMSQLGLPLMLQNVGKRTQGTYGNKLTAICYSVYSPCWFGLSR